MWMNYLLMEMLIDERIPNISKIGCKMLSKHPRKNFLDVHYEP